MRGDDWQENKDNGMDYTAAIHQRTEELYRIQNAELDGDGTVTLPVLPLSDMVIFPHMVAPLFALEGTAIDAIHAAEIDDQTMIGLVMSNPDIENPVPEDFLKIGVELAVGRLLEMPDGNNSALVQGRRRVEVLEFVETEPYMIVKARVIEEAVDVDMKTDALMRTTRDLFERCVQLDRTLPDEAHLVSINIAEPGWLSDLIVTTLSVDQKVRRELLQNVNPVSRLKKINRLLAQELDVLILEDEIQTKVQSEVDRTQREYYLREQMKAIQTELGEGDIWTREITELRKKVEDAHLPKEAGEAAAKELERLMQMPPMAPEVGIIRTYLDWLIELPWHNITEDNLDVKHAAAILEQYHYGLAKAKDRILEYIAVRSLKPKKLRQPILCFIGPPGTGKTSLGKSIAEALGRNFVRLSLGGVRDEAEIRGHRRTYIGAMPGRILQTMRRAGTQNPLFMLDEIDKLGADFRGDPAAALLEVLDPEQNNTFSDHYLELPFDLSHVMFITTANSAASIPPALMDRMELIEFPGYIEEDKLEISHRFLLKRQQEESGLPENEVSMVDAALSKIIREYTYEAGVRNLEREIGRVFRKVARLKSEGRVYPKRILPSMIEKFLGPPQFFSTEAEKQDEVGIATAMAWTEAGGDIMTIEVLIFDGKGNLQLTGQIGEVMQESAQAALSFLKSRAGQLNINPRIFEHCDIHIHIPEGAIPKDGPSAGITLATAMISGFTRREVYKDIAMTGEITLRGRVLPVGGVREKILAAHRANIKRILLPERNMKDLVDLPRKARAELQIIPVTSMDEVIEKALHPAKPVVKKTRAKRKVVKPVAAVEE